MAKQSAGLLMFRRHEGDVEVLLVHPGGPIWKNQDDGVWTFPRGEVEEGEDLLTAARREFREETGHEPGGELFSLGSVRNRSGKTIHAWAFEGDLDPAAIQSNIFTMEWPPKSGKMASFPEVDRAEFFSPEIARRKMREFERPLLEALINCVT